MKKIIVAMHVSLDGFVAGPNGEMDWIGIEDKMFDFVSNLTNDADSALYGRKTFEMMDSYWPTAADKPNATKHDKEHSKWYNEVTKYVLSDTMDGKDKVKTKFVGGNIGERINSIKQQSGKNILIFGSPTAVQSLMKENLVDQFYLFVNPILLGSGIPLFKSVVERRNFKLETSKVFNSTGVVCLHYLKS